MNPPRHIFTSQCPLRVQARDREIKELTLKLHEATLEITTLRTQLEVGWPAATAASIAAPLATSNEPKPLSLAFDLFVACAPPAGKGQREEAPTGPAGDIGRGAGFMQVRR